MFVVPSYMLVNDNKLMIIMTLFFFSNLYEFSIMASSLLMKLVSSDLAPSWPNLLSKFSDHNSPGYGNINSKAFNTQICKQQ